MIRLVFRPYTWIWRSICTSESLRASTRVSPGFTLFRHSSSSFGSQHICSHSDLSPEGLWPADCASNESNHCYFHYARRFATSVLAHMLDSLVRVSRRGKENHFASITSTEWLTSAQPRIAMTGTHLRRGRLPTKDLSQAKSRCWPTQIHSALTTSSKRSMNKLRHWFPSLPFQQFQVLFNSLFKVLCIFPSRYLCAIGLPPIFSFIWNLPHNLSCNPKQLDSLKAHTMTHRHQARTGVSPSQLPFSKGLSPAHWSMLPLQTTIRRAS